MARHKHKEAPRAWRQYWGDSSEGRENAQTFHAIGRPGHAYHGYCQFTGTHMVDAFCRCGAERYVGAQCPPRWIGGDLDTDSYEDY